MKKTIKSRILDHVESNGNEMSYSDIVKFAHHCKFKDTESAEKNWLANANRRGYFSDAFFGQWVYERPNDRHYSYKVGYLVKRGVKTGWLEKTPNRKYKTVRP